MNITGQFLRETTEKIINEGRKGAQFKINELTTPRQLLDKLPADVLEKFGHILQYKGIYSADYTVKFSALWSTLFWKIGEQILKVGSYQSPFDRFWKPLDIGGDIEEYAPRIKDSFDRQGLSNSAILSNYTTKYDSFFHRINQLRVFASTYDQYEIARISVSWDNLANNISAEMQNLEKSVSNYIHDLSKSAFVTQYLSGGMDEVTIPAITNVDTASLGAIAINTVIDEMTVEPSTKYIPWNRSTANPDPTIKDVAVGGINFIATTELLNNVEFMTALNTRFGDRFKNDRFSWNVTRVGEFPTTIDPRIEITRGYTPITPTKKLVGFICEDDSMIFRRKEIGRFQFDNAATLKTSLFYHIDALANISDRRKVVAVVQ